MINKTLIGKKLLVTLSEMIVTPNNIMCHGVCGTVQASTNTTVTIGSITVKKELIQAFVDVDDRVYVNERGIDYDDGREIETTSNIYFSDVIVRQVDFSDQVH